MTKRFSLRLLTLLLSLALLLGALTGCELPELPGGGTGGGTSGGADTTLASVPPFTDKAFVELNGGVPSFTEEEITTRSFEYYSDLDALGRCGVTFACIGQDLMPTEPRGSIGQVKPSGWKTVKYDIVDGKYLYNRCHLIGYQLTGENANEKNLITGTRYLNIDGMLTFENMVADYIKETGNHVMYRVTPIFVGDELVARGVVMEGYSVEDKGEGISFHVFSYNCQPGITIDYATGESHLMTEEEKAAAKNNQGNQDLSGGKTEPENPTTPDPGTKEDPAATEEQVTMVLNTKTKKYHRPDCASCKTIKAENREEYTGTLLDLQEKGYSPCGSCKPDESKTDNTASAARPAFLRAVPDRQTLFFCPKGAAQEPCGALGRSCEGRRGETGSPRFSTQRRATGEKPSAFSHRKETRRRRTPGSCAICINRGGVSLFTMPIAQIQKM